MRTLHWQLEKNNFVFDIVLHHDPEIQIMIIMHIVMTFNDLMKYFL